MLKKIIFLVFLVFFIPSVFALEREKINTDFFSKFNDLYLCCYINEAFENNHSAKQAAQKVEQYRQQAKISLGKEFPSLSAGANYLGTHTPNLGDMGNFNIDESAFIVPFIANWEADLLLKNRDKTKSAGKSYEISQQEEESVYLALLTDVATVYTNILQYDELIRNQSEIVSLTRDILNADIKKYDRGVIDNTALNDSENQLENMKSNLEELIKQREVLLMQLAVLLGRSSECAFDLERGSINKFEYQAVIPDEIPSDIIFARPDVRAAEKQLEKAKIDVRIARKELFPRFNIVGIWAFNTMAGGSFFSWDSSIAALLGGATMDLFKGGQKKANLKLYKSKYEELFENYKQVDLDAVKEVNTALCLIKHDTKIDYSTNKKLLNEQNNFINTQKKFSRGVVSNPDLLQERIKLLDERQSAIRTKTQRLVNYFTLYKAVGGRL